MTKLLYVVLHYGKHELEATVEDTDGFRRRINLSWRAKDATDLPPLGWFDSVCGEVELQRGEDNDRAKGRYIPDFG